MENQRRYYRLTLWIICVVASILMLVAANSIIHYVPNTSGGTLFDAIGAFLPYGLIISIAVYYFMRSSARPSRPALSATGMSAARLVRYILLMLGGWIISMTPFLFVFYIIAASGIDLSQSGNGYTTIPNVPSNPIQVGSPSFDLWSFLAIFSVVFVFGTLLLATIVRGKAHPIEETTDEELRPTIAVSYHRSEFRDDFDRRTILSYYSKGREHMTSQGVQLTEAMTPGEFERNVVTSSTEAGENFTPLTRLFEEARFSIHPLGASEKNEAKEHYENLKMINLKERKSIE